MQGVRGRRCAGAVLLAALLAAALGARTSEAAPTARFDSSTILVKFKAPATSAAVVRRLGDGLVGFTGVRVAIVKLQKGESVKKKVAQYDALPGVAYAEPNYIAAGGMDAPSDSAFGSQWNLAKIRAVEGWSAYPGSYDARTAVKLAVLDTGVDSRHEDLDDGRVLVALGANCLSGTCSSSSALDDHGHGTHVAGIAAAETNNGAGVAGMGYPVSVIPVKVLGSDNYGTYASISSGIVWAAKQGAKVLNLSIVGTAHSQTLCDAVAQAHSLGALVVAAAGNSGSSAPIYPASCSGAVGVSATTSSDGLASFSSYGRGNVFVAAPGASVTSTYPGNAYRQMSGTSMAAPHVAGLAALLFAQVPTRTLADVKQVLAQTSDKIVGGSGYGADPYSTCAGCTWSEYMGYGRVNAERALAAGGSAADFTLRVSPSLRTISAGDTATFTVDVAAFNGFGSPVQLDVVGLPLGATGKFSPAVVNGAGSSTLTVSTLALTLPGSYALTINGLAGANDRNATATIAVSTVALPVPVPIPTSSFTLTVDSPTRGVTKAGAPVLYTVRLTPNGTWSEPVVLSVTGIPEGTTAVFAPPVVPAPGASVLTLETTVTTAPGRYLLTVTGSSGSQTQSVATILDVK